ncbi:MAG: hypothetical protein HQL34_02225 [Alphaproteobacteria bacterium]|nr:hypothetical protein [Alphaproteobacteria bacterium]
MYRTMALAGVLLWPAVAGVLLWSGATAAGEFAVAGRQLVLSPPSGYCALGGDRADEADLIDRLRAGNAGRNRVLLAYARCDELERWRAGGERVLLHHGHVLTALTGGKEVPLDGTSRGAFITHLERSVPKLDRDALRNAVNKAVEGAGLGQLAHFKQGIAGKDDNALHVASLEVFEMGGRETAVAGMTSITLLKGLVISANLYRPFETEASFEPLLADAHATAAAMVAANPESVLAAAPASPVPDTPPRSWLGWVGAVAALGLLAAVPILRRRGASSREDPPCT